MNEIVIHGLKAATRIGVPDEERRDPQQVLINVTMIPLTAFAELDDDITRTVDYHAAAQKILSLAATGERRLIETLATEIARMLIQNFPATRAEVEVRKFILPETEYVAVRASEERIDRGSRTADCGSESGDDGAP